MGERSKGGQGRRMASKDFGYKSSEHLAEMSVPAEHKDTMGPKFQRSNLLVPKGAGLFSIKALFFFLVF